MNGRNCNQRILDLLDLCYQSVEDSSLWQVIVENASELFRADAADLMIENHARGNIEVPGSVGFDPSFRENYDELYFGKNPWIQKSSSLPICRAFSSELEPEGFEKTAFFGDWLEPQNLRHGLGSTLDCNRVQTIHFGLIRKRGRSQFEESEIGCLDRLLPHFRQSIRIAERLRSAGFERNNLAEILDRFLMPVILTDECRRIVLMNSAARRVLEDGGVIRVNRNNTIALADRQAEEKFGRFFSVVLNSCKPVPNKDSWQFAISRNNMNPLIASLTPVRMSNSNSDRPARFLVVLNDPDRKLQGNKAILRDAYGLTEAEASLASALARGERLAEYAANRGIGIGTARWHLKNVQAKTGKRNLESLTFLIGSALSNTIS